MSTRSALEKRLTPYWKLEFINAALMPFVMLLMAKGQLGWLSLFAILPMVCLLIVGGAYWREKVRQLVEPAHDIAPVLRQISRARVPLLALTVCAVLLSAAAWVQPALAIGNADRIAASFAASLAALEYVNYYHRQLQHFDHMADFKRLIAGKGFRQSKMAKDLRALR